MSESIREQLIRAGIIIPALERKDIIPEVETASISSPDSKKKPPSKRRKTVTKAIEKPPKKSKHRYTIAPGTDNLVIKTKKQNNNVLVKKKLVK